MNISPTVVTMWVVILSQVLPFIGIKVGSDALTTTAQTLIAVMGGLIVIYRRVSKGDINIFGGVK